MGYLIEGETGGWEVVVGLEVHAQIISKAKLFSGAATDFGAEPNSQVSLVDAAMPGMLPVINRVAVEQAVRTGLGLKAEINLFSVFDRKNYFYPDLPQGYQISQFEFPIVGEGEIEVRGPNLMRCYLDDPVATKEAFTADGWYRTGDLGRMDGEGYVYVTGRIKELIIKGGENISPREIDDVLYRYPGVLEAAAVAVPDQDYGEDILACVVVVPGSQIKEDALRAFCLEELGAFKSPRSFLFMDSLPKGPSGKIQRRKLSSDVSGQNSVGI